jgi:uncharacterized protein (DUF433 family)
MGEFNRIIRDPEICGGKPVIKDTRILVLDILDWLKEGKSFEEILANFPTISREDIQEIIAYAKEMISGEIILYGSRENEISTR